MGFGEVGGVLDTLEGFWRHWGGSEDVGWVLERLQGVWRCWRGFGGVETVGFGDSALPVGAYSNSWARGSQWTLSPVQPGSVCWAASCTSPSW